MRTPEDALRSLQKLLAAVLSDPWDIQFVRTEELERPGAVVRQTVPETDSGSAYVRDVLAPYEIFLYPEGREGDPQYGLIEAERLKNEIRQTISCGGHGAKAMRIPVFDYSEVAFDEGLDETAVPYDYLVVSNLRAGVRVDPEDDSLFNVIVDLTVTWRTDGDISRTQGALLQGVGLVHTENLAGSGPPP